MKGILLWSAWLWLLASACGWAAKTYDAGEAMTAVFIWPPDNGKFTMGQTMYATVVPKDLDHFIIPNNQNMLLENKEVNKYNWECNWEVTGPNGQPIDPGNISYFDFRCDATNLTENYLTHPDRDSDFEGNCKR